MTRDQANELLATITDPVERERFKQATFTLRHTLTIPEMRRMVRDGSAKVNDAMREFLDRKPTDS